MHLSLSLHAAAAQSPSDPPPPRASPACCATRSAALFVTVPPPSKWDGGLLSSGEGRVSLGYAEPEARVVTLAPGAASEDVRASQSVGASADATPAAAMVARLERNAVLEEGVLEKAPGSAVPAVAALWGGAVEAAVAAVEAARPFSPLVPGLGASLGAAHAAPSSSSGASQELHERIVLLQQRLSRSLARTSHPKRPKSGAQHG